MTDKRDTSLNISESSYLDQLKERAGRVDPLTQMVLEQQEMDRIEKVLEVSQLDSIIGALRGTGAFLSWEDMEKVIQGSKAQGASVGYQAGHQAGVAQGVKQGMASGQAKAYGTAAIAAGVAVVGYAVYKRFLSKAAKACKGKSGGEKSVCMAKFKADALQAKHKAMVANTKHCARAKNPAKCKALVVLKINKIKDELRKAKSKARG